MWLPGAERIDNPAIGPAWQRRTGAATPGRPYRLDGQVPYRIVWHTDEVDGGPATTRRMARTLGVPPQIWADPDHDLLLQMSDTRYAGLSLERRDPVETNHARAIQVEIAWRAGNSPWPDWWNEWLAARILAPLAGPDSDTPVNPKSSRVGLGPEAYGYGNPPEMTAREWLRFDSHCAHQDVYGQAHWDTGANDLRRISEAAALLLNDQPGDLTMSDITKILDRLDAIEANQKATDAKVDRVAADVKIAGSWTAAVAKAVDAYGPHGGFVKRTLRRLISHDEAMVDAHTGEDVGDAADVPEDGG